MAGLQLASLACLWALQRVALRAPHWRPVITSQLAGNALAKVAPGGGALGAALQYRMLVQAGLPPASTVSALTAVNLLVFAVVLALPVLAIPALLRGAVDRGLLETALLGLAVFAVASTVGAVFLSTDRPLAWVGRLIQRVRNRLRRGARAAAPPAAAAAARARPHPRRRSARAGSARCWRPSGAGRSTT